MTENGPKERRLHKRYSVDAVIDLGTGREGAALLRDISMSGLACQSPIPFDEMAILEITMQLPHPDGPVDFKAGGAVVRCDEDADGRHLVAIFFTHMDDGNRKVLEQFIDRQGQASPAV